MTQKLIFEEGDLIGFSPDRNGEIDDLGVVVMKKHYGLVVHWGDGQCSSEISTSTDAWRLKEKVWINFGPECEKTRLVINLKFAK